MRGDGDHNPGGHPAGDELSQTACRGRVVAVEGDIVTVQVSTPEACDVCRSKDGCHQAQLPGRQVEIKAAGFAVGDRVRVITSQRAVLRASIVLYGIPALLVIVGAFAGYATAVAFFAVSGDTGSMFGVVAGLLLGMVFAHFYKPDGGEGMELYIEKINQE